MISWIFDILRPYAGLVFPAFFIGFFILTLIAFAYNKNRMVRRTFVGGFMAFLVASNLFLPAPAPFVNWHKFSEVRGEEITIHEVRVVDAGGAEIRYDNSATWATDGVSMTLVINTILGEDSPVRQRELAEYLLQEAHEHREHLQNRSMVYLLRFPPHGSAGTWVTTELEEYDRFVGIRIYRMEIETSANGTEITGYSEEVVYEYNQSETKEKAMGTKASEPTGEFEAVPT